MLPSRHWPFTCHVEIMRHLLLFYLFLSLLPGAAIPPGTFITVRLIDPVDSDLNKPGDQFRASVDEPVIRDGVTLLPRGADAVLRLTSLTQAGKFRGRAEAQLELIQVSVDGRPVGLASDVSLRQGRSATRRTGMITGGGAVTGAVVGGLAGGPAGVGIGTLVGGGSGAVWQLLHKGPRLRIARETRLRFVTAYPEPTLKVRDASDTVPLARPPSGSPAPPPSR